MDKKKNSFACNIKLDENNYLEDKTVCKSCYNNNRRKNNNNALIKNQRHEFDHVNNYNKTNRTLIIGSSNCGKTYLMNYILLRK